MSRSTWACELKCRQLGVWFSNAGHAPRERVSWNNWDTSALCVENSHAPRERVSWNLIVHLLNRLHKVTLHVSVWVEIEGLFRPHGRTWSRSTWACELKCVFEVELTNVIASRSTWACELKFSPAILTVSSLRHAPRERVSWNARYHWRTSNEFCHAPRERVSWNDRDKKPCDIGYVTLHVSVWVEM